MSARSTSPWRRLVRSRAWRKFTRNRLAVAALLVIVAYALVALAVLTPGVFPLAQAEQVVGPINKSGLFLRQTNEKRLQDAEFVLTAIDRALRSRGDARTAVAALGWAELRPIDVAPEELRPMVDEAFEIVDELVESDDLDLDPSASEVLDRLDAKVASLLEPLTGWDKFVYDARLCLGTDRQGRSVLMRGIYSVKVALQVGLIVSIISVIIGSVLGAVAAYYGSWVDHVVVWLYSTLSSVPEIVLLAVLVFMFTGSVFDSVSNPELALVPMYVAMCMTFWIGPCRVIRGEVLKLRELEYVQAATAIGFGRLYIVLRHVLPNTLHLVFINASLIFIAAIKFEVVLSFLNLGVKVGPSWGRMIQESAPEVINGVYWQIGTATVFLFVLVLAFNILTDALQDALDPKHVG